MAKVPINQLFKNGENMKFKIPNLDQIINDHKQVKKRRAQIRRDHIQSQIPPKDYQWIPLQTRS